MNKNNENINKNNAKRMRNSRKMKCMTIKEYAELMRVTPKT